MVETFECFRENTLHCLMQQKAANRTAGLRNIVDQLVGNSLAEKIQNGSFSAT